MGGVPERHRRDCGDHREDEGFHNKTPASFSLKVIMTDAPERRTQVVGALAVATGERDRLIIAIGDRESARIGIFERLVPPGAMDLLGAWFRG